MKELELCIGGHLTSGRLFLGRHINNGMIELYNSLARLYSSFETAIVPDLASGKCTLRKPSAGAACVVSDLSDVETVLNVMSDAYTGCIPATELAVAALTLSGSVSAEIVPDVSGPGQLNCAAHGGSAAEVLIQSIQSELLHKFGYVHGPVEVLVQRMEAGLDKWNNSHLSAVPGCAAGASQEKSSEGESGIAVLSEAEALVLRYRKLCEVDPLTLEEMDEMTLGDLDYIIY